MAAKKKIVIIGGGISGLAAAFGLTMPPNWQDQYEITVFQLGWRLGGKGASGRNPEAQQRIEEHGLHVWGGFYENAFRVMRACYTELNRPPTSPLATWDEAFKPSAMVSWMEELNNSWLQWNNSFPEYPEFTPGDGTPMPSLLEGILRVIEWIIQTALEPAFAPAAKESAMEASPTNVDSPIWIQRLVAEAEVRFAIRMAPPRDSKLADLVKSKTYSAEMGLLTDAYKLLRAAQPDDPSAHPPEVHQAAVWLLRAFRRQSMVSMAACKPLHSPSRPRLRHRYSRHFLCAIKRNLRRTNRGNSRLD
jgi:NAD(P)-binding Rossmann-like domain